MRTYLSLIMAFGAVLAQGCDNRSLPSADGAAGLDGSPPQQDLWLSDGPAPVPDLARVDLGRADGQTTLLDAGTLCSGADKLVVDGNQLAISTVKSSPTITSCCTGEQVSVHALDAAGVPAVVTFAMLRFPEASDGVTQIDLTSPPKGWGFFFKCEPYLACGYLNTSNSGFSGTVSRAFPVTGSDLMVTVCATAVPLAGAPPETKPVALYLKDVLIHRACTPGMDQTCNYDPMISSIKGVCNEDGTCTCARSTTKMPNGKCK
jgi:hypothetical protein